MTLFKKSDWDLPLLTRFYQINPPAEDFEEVKSGFGPLIFEDENGEPYTPDEKEASSYYESEALYHMEMYRFLLEDWINRMPPGTDSKKFRCEINPEKYQSEIEVVMEYGQLHAIVREVMIAMADNYTVAISSLHKIEEMIVLRQKQKHFLVQDPDRPYAWVRPDDIYTSDSEIPISELVFRSGSSKFTPLKERIILELEMLFVDRPPVLRCEICREPFVAAIPGQHYCSNRCSGTARARRSRLNKLKEEEQEDQSIGVSLQGAKIG